METNQI